MKDLKLSYYTIPIELSKNKKKLILIHGNTGAIDIVSKGLYYSLKNTICRSNDIPTSIKEKLISRGYLTTKTKEEEIENTSKQIEIMYKHDFFKSCDITWVVSYKCNFRCPYCFEKNRKYSNTFSKEMANFAYTAIDAYKKEYKTKEMHSIVLFGGEPLLAENRDIVEYIVTEGEKRGYTFSAVTNGYDLDKYIDLINKKRINKIQVTLDGKREMHNQRRMHYLYGNSFDKIISNLKAIKDKGIQISIRMNVDKNGVHEFSELCKYLKDMDILDNNVKIHAARLMKHEDVDLNERKDIYIPSVNEYIKLHQRYKTLDRCKDYDIKSRFLFAINQNKAFPFKTAGCAISKGGIVIDPLGDIYPCWELIGRKEHVIGNFSQGHFVLNEMSSIWYRSPLLNDEKCRKCKFALICGGGCPKRTETERRQHCLLFQKIFYVAINNAYNEMKFKETP